MSFFKGYTKGMTNKDLITCVSNYQLTAKTEFIDPIIVSVLKVLRIIKPLRHHFDAQNKLKYFVLSCFRKIISYA